ncbi:MAG: leucyl/phenylalanyl-tRNA--protein transferase [Prevotella sp.]
MAVYLLDNDLWFPDPHEGEENGLIAVGGDLSVNRLLLAYSYGIFPWFSFRCNEEPHWYCPLDRFVIFPNDIHISHSMRQLIRQQKYLTTINQDFCGVIRGCSTAAGRNQEYGAWLGSDMIKAYTKLHNLGYATSVEVWELQNTTNGSRKLVGGLYGITLRNAFFGESMFSLVPNASKLALIHLAQTMAANNGIFIDCQFETPHLLSMGGKHISYDEYMRLLTS